MATEFIVKNPLISIAVLSLLITLAVTIIYKFTTNQKRLKELKDDMKRMRDDMKKYQTDPKKMMELQQESMKKSFEQMKHTLLPTFITMVPILVIFAWIRSSLSDKTVILQFPFNIPKIGDNSGFGWIGIYVITSIVFSIVLRKLFKVY